MGKRVQKVLKRDWQLLVLCALPVLYFIVFHYIPMYGVQIAFKDFKATDGIWVLSGILSGPKPYHFQSN